MSVFGRGRVSPATAEPQSTTQELKRKTEDVAPPFAQQQPRDMHCSLYFRYSGPDERCESKLYKTPTADLRRTHLYWDGTGLVGQSATFWKRTIHSLGGSRQQAACGNLWEGVSRFTIHTQYKHTQPSSTGLL